MNKKIKLFIVDDHQMLIDGIKSLLMNEEDFELIGEAISGEMALEKITMFPVDILITDIKMPGMDGIELSKVMKKQFPATKILALSMYSNSEMISTMLEAGVSGYILKNTGKQELIHALKQIDEGKLFFSDEVSAEMMKAMTSSAQITNNEISLTLREKEVLELITKEYNNAKIADTLFISERTVESHRKNIFRKTNTKTIVGLIKFAYENRLIE
jgi:two-component system nitrate/nitrite response regulator NarL